MCNSSDVKVVSLTYMWRDILGSPLQADYRKEHKHCGSFKTLFKMTCQFLAPFRFGGGGGSFRDALYLDSNVNISLYKI